MAVFVFGIMLGNKERFGFRMEPGEAQKLDEFVLTTAFILRLFIFILLGAQVDFALIGLLARRRRRRRRADAGGATRNGVPVRIAGSPRALEFCRDAVHVLDPRDRRHSRRARRAAARA